MDLGPILPHIPGFLTGLFLAFLVWLVIDRKQIKAELATLKAKAAPAMTTIQHDVHLAEAALKVPADDVKTVLQSFLADIRAEAARIEAAKAASPVPAAPAAPQA